MRFKLLATKTARIMKGLLLIVSVITILSFAGCESSSESENTDVSGGYYGKINNWDKGTGYNAKFIYRSAQGLEEASFPVNGEGIFEMTLPDTLPAASLLEMTEYLGLPDTVFYDWEGYNFKIMYGSFTLIKDNQELGPVLYYAKSGDTIITPQYAELIYSNKDATIRGLETVEHEIGIRNVYLDLKLYKGWNKVVKTFAVTDDTVMNESYTRGSGNLFNLYYYGQ